MSINWCGLLWLVGLTGVVAGGGADVLDQIARAADQLPAAQVDQVGNEVTARLDHVEQLLRAAQWNDAVAAMQRVMNEHGDVLIKLPGADAGGSWQVEQFVPVRTYCQIQMSHWARRVPPALASYRRQVGRLAARLWEQGQNTRDVRLLGRIAERFLLSDVGDDALLRLGDIALERGDYVAARRYWLRLAPMLLVPADAAVQLGCPAGTPWGRALRDKDLDALQPLVDKAPGQDVEIPKGVQVYPDTDVPLAEIWARLVLVSLLEHDRARARAELYLLGKWFPDSRGVLAHQKGRLVDIVTQMCRDSDGWRTGSASTDWATLGGVCARDLKVTQPLDPALRPMWQVALPRLAVTDDLHMVGRPRVGEEAAGLLAYHVACAAGVVFVHQPGSIRALTLAAGVPAWPLPRAGPAGNAESGEIYAWARGDVAAVPHAAIRAGVPRYCVTVDRGRLFARMGSAWTGGAVTSRAAADQKSFLLGLDIRTQKLLFDRIFPDESGWQFEAAPVVDAAQVYISARRRGPVNSQVCVLAYDIATGRKIWQTSVARASTSSAARLEISHSPLTLAGDTIYYNSSLGAVAALQASDGRVRWLVRYPRCGSQAEIADIDDRHVGRELTPCLPVADRIIVAAADSDRIFALDATTGALAWVTPAGHASDAIHLLGVGAGNLLASGDSLYWIRAADGKPVGRFPAASSPGREFGRALPRGYGRGLLAGQYVYWPTKSFLYVLDQTGPRLARQPINLAAMGIEGGNLTVAQNMLLIASAERLVALRLAGPTPGQATPISKLDRR